MLNAVLLSFGVIFVAEMGDKSQLMALALAARTLRGDSLDDDELAKAEVSSDRQRNAVVAASIAIVIGLHLGKRLPERFIRMGASVLFVLFGVLLIIEDAAS
jgi:putative Ca2+/H+ antiporter (TMEM165/GDT1 family)